MINADASVKKLVNYMTDEWHGGNGDVVLVTDVDEAQGDTEQLALVHDALGSSSTNYSSSNSNRKQNVKRGAELVNGTVLYPGEEFSMEEIVVPFTAENGYAPAASYEMEAWWRLTEGESARFRRPCIWRCSVRSWKSRSAPAIR